MKTELTKHGPLQVCLETKPEVFVKKEIGRRK
jgi:hypothetical protein